MGRKLNRSLDAMPIARFDWTHGRTLLSSCDGRASAEIERAFAAAVTEHLGGRTARRDWGWKHPHSYLLLPFLSARFSELRFVHVLRDGRDMALSRNQNQVRHYGDLVLGPGDWSIERSLRFWAWANLRAERHGRELLGDRYLLLRCEDLWEHPRSQCERLLTFAGADVGAVPTAQRIVVAPTTAGRWRSTTPSVVSDLPPLCETALAHFAYAV
jgi:hypothetical protein